MRVIARLTGRGFRVAVLLAVGVGIRILLPHVSFVWTLALVGVAATLGAVAFVRRWRARPTPVQTTHGALAAATPAVAVGEYSAISYRRKWTILPLLVFVPLLAGCGWLVWLLAADPAHTTWEAVGVALFGLCGIFVAWWTYVSIQRLISHRPALYVDHEGIVDATGGVAYHRICWHEISDLRWASRSGPYGIGTYPFLAIDLAHPGEYLARQSGWRRTLALWRWKTAADPVKINVQVLAVSYDEIVHLLRRYSHNRVRIID
jgi:hypothetical protein